MAETVQDLLMEYGPESFPSDHGPWTREDDCDPRWLRVTLRAAARKGLIQIEDTKAESWRFRFTLKASAERQALIKDTSP